jgi:hypothetical protein
VMGSWELFFPKLAWNCDPPNFSLLHSWDDKCMPLCKAIGWDEVSQFFLPELTLNHNPPDFWLPSS